MRKITLLLLFLSTLWGYSQVRGYTFSQTTEGTYTEIHGGTLLGNIYNDNLRFIDPLKLSGDLGTVAGAGFDIGFDFVFNEFTYNRFAVVTDGWIALGTSTNNPAVCTTSKNLASPMDSDHTILPELLATKICPLGNDLAGQTGASLRFETIGEAPNRVLVVQWENYRRVGASGDSFDFQVRLYETSNKVEFVYGTMTTTTSATYQVGLRAMPSAIASNFANRTSSIGWDTTTAGKSASDGMLMNNVIKPASGLTYSWTSGTCGSAKSLTVSALTASGATLNWNHYSPAPSGYEYIVTTSTALPTGSGTITTASTASVVDLIPNTVYNVFMRAFCGTEYTPWALERTFRTNCSDGVTSFSENFDSYMDAWMSVPYCWAKGGNAQAFMNYGGAYPGSAPMILYMNGNGLGSPSSSYVVFPKVTNLQAETHRLKFKAYSTEAERTLDVGYYTDNTNFNSFVLLQTVDLPSATASSAIEFVITPKSIPVGVKCLGFRNKGVVTGSTPAYIDDVIWEQIPSCPDPKSLVVKGVFSTSAKISWTPGGAETAWQYVYAPAPFYDPKDPNPPVYANPSTLVPVDVNTSTPTIDGFATSTAYNVWVRSKCGDNSYSSWIGPIYFTTTCAPVTEFVQKFDASGSFPPCWRKVGANGIGAPQNTSAAPSGPNTLYMVGYSPTQKSIVAMEPVSNIDAGTHRLKFKFRGSAIGAKLEVGYLTNIIDEESFVAVQSYTATSATLYDDIITGLGAVPAMSYLAFRVPGYPESTVYIDDVVWEPNAICPEVSAVTLNTMTSNSIDISWTTSGTENEWQYAVGAPGTTNPYSLTAVDFVTAPLVFGANASGTITGLTPSTSYKVWLRSKCSSTSLGAWVGPFSFATTCAPVSEFIQSFDSVQPLTLPSCWTKVGTGGGGMVIALSSPSYPNVLSIYSSGGAVSTRGIVAMQPLSNTDAGTHRLRFKYRINTANAVLEVGYLTNINDPGSFNPLRTFTSTSTTEFKDAIAELGVEPESQFLAFRNAGDPSGTVYIDDVVWEPISACADISGLFADLAGSTSIKLSWKGWGTETAWQYVIGASTVTDPTTLTPVDVTATAITINGLTPSTSYKVWVRAKCNSTPLGGWIGSLNFATSCPPVTEFAQNFDSSINFPSCWSKVGVDGTVSVSLLEGASSPNVAGINSGSTYFNGVLALQPVSNADAKNHRLRFKFRGNVVGTKLELGYLTNILDPKSFIPLATFSASSITVFDLKKVTPDVPANIQILAFRNPGVPSSTVYVDDVFWEAIPTCPDITTIATNGTMSNSVGLKWTAESTAPAWQYVIGASTITNPSTLTPVDVTSASATVMNLTPSTTYKVWVRSKCDDATFGVWSDSFSFTTLCAGVTTFSQNFDANTLMPVCWKKVGTVGSVSVSPISGFGAPNALILNSSTTAKAIVAMPNVSNASAGTQRLKFKFRSSVVNGVLELGYVTDINDQSTFVPLESYVSSSTSVFTSKEAVLGTKPVVGSILAFRNPGNPVCFIYVDEVSWEFNPFCSDVTNVVAKLPTSNSVQLSWDTTGTETAWQYAYAPSTVTDPGTLPSTSIFDVNSKAITINGLTPNASYKIWVRSNCGSGIYGLWSQSKVFQMPCPSVETITENFNAGLILPDCWHLVGTTGSIAIAASSTNALELKTTEPNIAAFAAIPSLSTAVAGGYRLRFKYKASISNTKVEVICYKDPINLNGAGSFTVLKTINVAAGNTEYVFDQVLPAAETAHLGLRVYHAQAGITLYVDDFEYGLPLPTSCATGIIVSPNANCGNLGTQIYWPAVPYAGGYKLTVGTTLGGKDVVNNLELGDVSNYSFKGQPNTKYYFTLIPYNALGAATGCMEESFNTAANNCYCPSEPSSYDGTGITKVQLGASNFASGFLTYKDFTEKQVNLVEGVKSNLKIYFNTGSFGYWTNVWIDFNDNFEFEPSENVYMGKATATGVFDASFMMPVAAPLGVHRMRIGAASEQQVPANPCYSGANGVTLDFKVNIVTPVPNDEPVAAIMLTTGGVFAANAITGTNVNATGSILETEPGCGNYNGMDVWYKAVVPVSGNITFEVNSVSGGITNTAAAVYSGTLGALTFVSCDDSSSAIAGGDQPKIVLTGRTAGEVLYFRVWENGGDALGSFLVSAYDSVLGVDSFDNSNFTFYPNPVRDILNISLDKEITDVTIFNLLGQEVITKSVNSNLVKADMSGLTAGTYLVKVTADNQTKTIKVVKE